MAERGVELTREQLRDLLARACAAGWNIDTTLMSGEDAVRALSPKEFTEAEWQPYYEVADFLLHEALDD